MSSQLDVAVDVKVDGVDNLDRAAAGIDNVEQHASKFGAVTTGIFQGVGQAAVGFGVGIVKAGIDAAIDNIGTSIELASNKAEAASKAQVLFGDSYQLIADKAATAATDVGVSSGVYLELAGNVGNLVTNFGFAGDEAAGMSADIVQLSADVGSFNNAPTADVVEAIGAAFRGESEPIRRFGVMLDEATIKQKALELGLYDGQGALDKSARATATYQLILEQTSKAQGDFARTSDGYANSQRIASAKIDDALTKIGDKIVPLATKMLPALADAISAAVDWIIEISDAAGAWIAANQDTVDTVSDLVQSGVKLLSDAMHTLIDVTLDIVGAIGDWADDNRDLIATIADLIGKGINLAIAAIQTTIDVAGKLWDFLDGPISTVLGIVGGLFSTLAGFVGTAIDILGKLVDLIKGPLDAALGIVKGALDIVAGAFGMVGDAVQQAVDPIGAAADQVKPQFEAMARAAGLSADEIARAWDDAVQSARDGGAGATQPMDQYIQSWSDANTSINADAERIAHSVSEHADEVAAAVGRASIDVPLLGTLWQATADDVATATDDVVVNVDGMSDKVNQSIENMSRGALEALDNPAQWLAIGATIPTDIAKGMSDAGREVLDAADRLIQLLKDGLSPAEEAAKLEGEKYTKAVARGMTSEIPGAKDAARETAVSAIKVIEDAADGTPSTKGLDAIGKYYDALLAGGMDDKAIAVALAAAGVAGDVVQRLTGYQPDFDAQGKAYDAHLASGIDASSGKVDTAVDNATDPLQDVPTDKWGADVGDAWINAFAASVRGGKSTINSAIQKATAATRGMSPPREGPLHQIDKWGANIGHAWVAGMADGIIAGAGQLDGALGRIIPDQLNGASSIAGFGSSSGSSSSSPIVVNVYAGVGDAVAIGREVSEALRAYQRASGNESTGLRPLAG